MPRITAPDPQRQLMIKTKVCQRLQKEVAHYRKEVIDNETQWQRVKADPTKDEYDAKRYHDLYEESIRMVPDAERRLQTAVTDLSGHVEQYFANGDQEDEKNEWLPIANEILKSLKASVKESSNAEEGGAGGETTNVDDLAEGEVF